ncbi:lysophosphatidic acid receptor 1-A-like [Babylonia areolata]|uniref:lysophosphatidic acid receptor 1-A-like n=1 Tax=Babylonia areolata TaxID=304850 RepID=UPI003FD495FF
MHPDYLRLILCLYFVPGVLMGIVYGHVYKVARRHSRQIQSQHSSATRRSQRHTWRFTKTIVLIVGLYFLCWLPIGVVIILHLEGRLWQYSLAERGNLLMYSSIPAFAGSLANPIIYAVKILPVRARFQSVFCRRHIDTFYTGTSVAPTTGHAWTTDQQSRQLTCDGQGRMLKGGGGGGLEL